MQYSSKQVTGRKGGKKKGRKKGKYQKRQTRWKRMVIYHTKYHFYGILSYGYISFYLYWFTDDALAALMKFDFYLTLSLCFCILHRSQSHNQGKWYSWILEWSMFEGGTLMMFEFFICIHSPSRDPTNTMHDWSFLTLFLFEITETNTKILKSTS